MQRWERKGAREPGKEAAGAFDGTIRSNPQQLIDQRSVAEDLRGRRGRVGLGLAKSIAIIEVLDEHDTI